jgi:hypothetical protein
MKVGIEQALVPKSGESKDVDSGARPSPSVERRISPDSRQQAESGRRTSENESRDGTSIFIVRSWDTDRNASPLNISFGLSESMQDDVSGNDRYGGCSFIGFCQSLVDDERPNNRFEIPKHPPLPRSSRTTQSAQIKPLTGTKHSAKKETSPELRVRPPMDKLEEKSVSTAVISNSQLKTSRNVSSAKEERGDSGACSKVEKTKAKKRKRKGVGLRGIGMRSHKGPVRAGETNKHLKEENSPNARGGIKTRSKSTAVTKPELSIESRPKNTVATVITGSSRLSGRSIVTGSKNKACAVAKSFGKPVEIKPISFQRRTNSKQKAAFTLAEQKQANMPVRIIKSLGKPVQAKPLSFRKAKESELPQATTGTSTIQDSSIVPNNVSEPRDLEFIREQNYNESIGPIKAFVKPAVLNPVSVRKIQRKFASSANAMMRRNKDRAIVKAMIYLGTPVQAKPKTMRSLNKSAANKVKDDPL